MSRNKKYPYFLIVHSIIARVDNPKTIFFFAKDGIRDIVEVKSVYNEKEFLSGYSPNKISEEEIALMLSP